MIPKIMTNCVKNLIKGINMQIWYSKIDLKYEYKNKAKPFCLNRAILYVIDYANKRKRITVEKGFKTDGCTIPNIFWAIIGCPHSSEYIPASIIHDYILQHPELVNYNRKFASRIFKSVLITEGVKPLKAQIMYLAVDLWQAVKNIFKRKWR